MTTPKQNILIFALLGQSNMDGTGSLAEFDNYTDDRILRVSRENKLVLASEPLNEGKAKSGDDACVGPGIPFARNIVDHFPGKKIALLHRGAGGSQLSQWVPGGNSYGISIRLLKAAQELGTLAGVLWHQGESDSNDKKKAETYAKRFKLFANGIREDMGIPDLPIVAGQIGPFVETDPEHPYAKIVNQQILGLAKQIDNLATITSEGTTHIGDGLHLETRSQLLMGERYAKRMIELLR